MIPAGMSERQDGMFYLQPHLIGDSPTLAVALECFQPFEHVLEIVIDGQNLTEVVLRSSTFEDFS